MPTPPRARRATAAAAVLATAAATAASFATSADAVSPSYAVVCSSATVEAARNVDTTFTLSCTTADGDPVDRYVASPPAKAASFKMDALTGEVTYRPLAGAVGTDTFWFRGVVDGLGQSEATQAVITLDNERPVCDAVSPLSVVHDRSATVPLSCGDPDGDVLVVRTGTTGAAHGSVTVADGTVSYTPAPGWTGSDGFTLLASDGDRSSEEVAVTVQVTNARPVCSGRDVTVSHDQASKLGLRCTDADGDDLTGQVVAAAQHGSVSVVGDHLVYRPAAGYLGKDTFSVGATDGLRASRPVSYEVKVTNAAPRCSGDTEFRTQGAHEVAFDCTDRDGDRVRVRVDDQPRHGSIERDHGTVTYVPERGYRGKDSFALVGTDSIARSKPVEYSVKVLRRR